MTKRYITVPDDVTIFDPFQNIPVADAYHPETGERLSDPAILQTRNDWIPKIRTESFASYIRILCEFLMRKVEQKTELADLRADLSGPPGQPSVKPGDILEVNDTDPMFLAIQKTAANPDGVFLENSMACCVISYRPFVRALHDATTTKPVKVETSNHVSAKPDITVVSATETAAS